MTGSSGTTASRSPPRTAKQKAITEAVQVRVTEYPTHVHLGQWYSPFAVRSTIDGNVTAPVTVFWNVSKK